MSKNDKGTAGQSPSAGVNKQKFKSDPVRRAEFDIDRYLIALAWAEPFYAQIIRSLTKVEDDTIQTAGVVQKGSEIMMWWNRDFMASLTNEQVDGVLRHEALHLVLLHTTLRRYHPHWVWNWATDLAINSMIPYNRLPDFGLKPGVPFPPLTPEQLKEYTPEDVERHNKISALIASFPKDQSSEWYFSKLLDDPTVQQMEKQRALNEAAFKEALKRLGDATGAGMGDDHEGWGDSGDVSEEDRQLVEGKVRQIMKEATERADKTNNWGTVPSTMQAWIRKIISGEIPWQSILRQFIGYTHRQDRLETWVRSSRKDPLGQPGVSYNYLPNIAIFVDQSGSVPDSSLELFFGELASLSRKATFTVFYFDTEVDEKNKFIWRKGTQVRPQRTRCGGTDFQAPTNYADNHKEIDAYMILTDGGAPKPTSSRQRRAWILDPGNELAFPDPDSKDIIIKMKHLEKN